MQGWLVGLKRRFCCPFCHTVFACVLTGLEANAFTFSSAIKGCERQGCWEAVCGLLLHMKEEGIQENSYTFNACNWDLWQSTIVACCIVFDQRDGGAEGSIGYDYWKRINRCIGSLDLFWAPLRVNFWFPNDTPKHPWMCSQVTMVRRRVLSGNPLCIASNCWLLLRFQ